MPKTKTKTAKTATDELPEAGELLALEALDHTGLFINSEGALCRVIKVTPPNPLIRSDEERQQIAQVYCNVIGKLRPQQSLQFYVEARPVKLGEILANARREVEAWSGEPPVKGRQARDDLALSLWRLYGGMEESLRRHADEQAAMHVSFYIVVPYVPGSRSARALLDDLKPGKKMPTADLHRELKAHRRAVRESLAHTDAIRSDLEGMSLPTRLLNGEEVATLLWSRFNPTRADRGQAPATMQTEVLGQLDEPIDFEEARAAAIKLRENIARSPLDFKRSDDFVVVDRDIEQTIYAESTADATSMGWLMRAMMTRQPFTMSVFVHALDRNRERAKAKRGYRTTFALLRGAEARGRVPDFDKYAKEAEQERLLAEMAGSDRTSLYRVSIYQTIRVRGPEPDVATLSEAVDFCREQIESASDTKVNGGRWQQEDLWPTSLPLGRDVANRAFKYATRNVGDTIPLVGTSCGSPSGIPFAYSDPGRELQLINFWDRAHPNGMCVISGESGSGKTNTLNTLLGRALSIGARGFVIDRAGHFSTLVALVDGARQITLGSDEEQYAINPWDVDDPAGDIREKVSFLVDLHIAMMGDEGLTRLEASHLGQAIRAVYGRVAVGDVSFARESVLVDELRKRSQAETEGGDVGIGAMLRSLADRLGEFCGDGSFSFLLDKRTNVPTDSPLIVFDTRRVPDSIIGPVMFATLEFITRTVEAHRDAFAQIAARPNAPIAAGKSILVCDEFWHMVAREVTGQYANNLARRSRHLGLALLVATQQHSDLNTPSGVALLKNAAMHLFLANNPSEIDWIRETLAYSAQEAAVMKRVKTVKGSQAGAFWDNGERGRGQVAIRLGPTEQWAYTSEPTRDAPRRAQAINEHDGDVWAAIAALARAGGPGERVAA
jgi:hypothetical protein